jgi:YegS/Rv2252/BmrU family lipid kinase
LEVELKDMVKVTFIVNGNRTLKKRNNEIIQKALNHPSLDVTLIITTYAKEALKLSQETCNQNTEIIIAVGGDGTINEVVNGILLANKSAIFGYLPNGTGNDFSRNFKPIQSEAFIQALVSKKYTKIDTIKTTFDQEIKQCVNIADVGLGGKVIEILERQRSIIGGKISYNLAIVRGFLAFKKPEMEIESDAYKNKKRMLMVAICNGNYFAHGLTVNPFAQLNDGFLHITTFEKVSLLDYIRELPKLKKGLKITHPEVNYFKTKKVTIVGDRLYGELDGEGFKANTIEFEIQEKSLSILDLENTE